MSGISLLRWSCYSILAASCYVQSAQAVVLGFRPGDAFFHARLTKEIAVDQAKDHPDTIEFEYSDQAKDHPDTNELAFSDVFRAGGPTGGYAGFQRLTITNVPQTMRRQLRQVYWRIREVFPRELRTLNDGTLDEYGEMNALDVFVYNRDVDWHQQRFAIKYDENWAREPDESRVALARRVFQSKPLAAQAYKSFVDSTYAVVEDWKNGARYPHLNAVIPVDVPWEFLGGRSNNQPIVVDAKDIQIIVVVTNDSISALYERRLAPSFVSVTVDGATLVELSARDVTELKWDPEKEPYGTIHRVEYDRFIPAELREVAPLPDEH